MDLHTLEQHEAFLRAIFDAPEDDLPRLVYADFLEDRQEEALAQVIRLSVEARHVRDDVLRFGTLNAMIFNVYRPTNMSQTIVNAFIDPIVREEIQIDLLDDGYRFRLFCVCENPALFGASYFHFRNGVIKTNSQIEVLFNSPAIRKMQKARIMADFQKDGYSSPTISTSGVLALVSHRKSKHLEELDLTYNDLGNDAARALINSPYLENLKVLKLLNGNRLRGRVWQQVLERFGPDVAQ